MVISDVNMLQHIGTKDNQEGEQDLMLTASAGFASCSLQSDTDFAAL